MGTSATNPAGFIGLMLLFPTLVTALECNSLSHPQRMINAQFLQLLAQTGPNIPPECLAQTTGFNFPAKELNVTEPQLARRAAYEILRGLLGLFSGNPVQTGWETTAQDRLLNALYAQTERIKRCFDEEKTEPGSPDESLNKLKLRGYFRRIRTFLQEKSRSPCVGIIVQLGVRTCLTHLDVLINSVSA